MASDKELKNRIKSIKGIGQITQAMKLVASAQLRKVETIGHACAPYNERLFEAVNELREKAGELTHPLLEAKGVPADERRLAIIVVGSDNGLCGSYNTNVLRLFEESLDKIEEPERLIAIGKKAIKYCNKRGLTIDHEISSWKADYKLAKDLAEICAQWYLNDEVDEVWCFLTYFVNKIKCEARSLRLLPLAMKEFASGEFGPDVRMIAQARHAVSRKKRDKLSVGGRVSTRGASKYVRGDSNLGGGENIETTHSTIDIASNLAVGDDELADDAVSNAVSRFDNYDGVDDLVDLSDLEPDSEEYDGENDLDDEGEKLDLDAGEMVFEPNVKDALRILVPNFFRVVMHQMLLNCKTSELSTRLNAMTNASDNADELVMKLTQEYYRIRQNNITNEIIEIASSAEALS